MIPLGEFLENRRAKKKWTPATKEQWLASVIYEHFRRRLPFGRIMRDIKRKGFQFVYECFERSKGAKKSQLALFVYLVKRGVIEWEESYQHPPLAGKDNR